MKIADLEGCKATLTYLLTTERNKNQRLEQERKRLEQRIDELGQRDLPNNETGSVESRSCDLPCQDDIQRFLRQHASGIPVGTKLAIPVPILLFAQYVFSNS